MWGAQSLTNSARGSGTLNKERKEVCDVCACAAPLKRKNDRIAAEQMRTNMQDL
jgi:hypothetical protein